MTKKEAIKQLINDFHNKIISQDWEFYDELDEEIAKALKLKKEKRI